MWLVDGTANILQCLDIWHKTLLEMDEFVVTSKTTTFALGVGLPGRIWGSSQPVWIVDVADDVNFKRSQIAAQAGLHTAFGFPVFSGNTTVGVMTFFNREILQPDTDLLMVMTSIGNQVGQFIKRKQAEEELTAKICEVICLPKSPSKFANPYKLKTFFKLQSQRYGRFSKAIAS